jgi:Protein kinase domain/AAA-like domain
MVFLPQLSSQLRTLFGTAREVLVWVVEAPTFQARTVMQAQEILERERPRLCEDFAIIFTPDPNTERNVAETAANLTTYYIGFSTRDIRELRSSFLQSLQIRLYSADLYNVSTAIRSADDFFGRKGLISELVAELRQGSRHLGIFGLRKMGKTSLLYRIISTLRNTESAYVAQLELERIDSINPTGEYFLWSLGEAIYDSHRAIRRIPGLRLFGRHNLFSDIPQPKSVWELFDHDLTRIIHSVSRPLVLAIDEIELMWPTSSRTDWGDAFIRIWRLLRGIDQSNPGKLSFLVSGTNPHCVEAHDVLGRDNPAYNFFDVRFLPPFDEDECYLLLSQLGDRMGLRWKPEGVSRIYRLVGGYPYLLRSYASLIHRRLLPRKTVATIEAPLVQGLVNSFIIERGSSLSQIVAVLEEQYPSEMFLLEKLASGRVGEFRGLSNAFPTDTAHLIGYGLVSATMSDTGLAIEVLQTWLQRREAIRAQPSTSSSEAELAPGSQFEGYEIISSVGRKGGFARVYKAIRTADKTVVALKVLHEGSFLKLQREVDALQSIADSRIVRILDSGVDAEGRVYLAMEYLDGPTLRSFCERSSRIVGEPFDDLLADLLGALTILHPEPEEIGDLRRSEELDMDEFRRLIEARHGYIHRDIKPENIILVPKRGPVLIDFNISSKAATPIKTMSATPGYLPPGTGIGIWEPRIDLYQLGLTMLQVGIGVEFDGSNLEDLRRIADTELSVGTRDVIFGLLDQRYPSAHAALRALARSSKGIATRS